MSELEKRMLLLVKSSCLDTHYQLTQHWSVSSVENIENTNFADNYESKRSLMKQLGRRDDETIDRCVFVCYNNKDRVTRVVQSGITVSTSSINYLGNCAKGVMLCRHADVLLKIAAVERKDRCWLIICKAMFGRVSHVVASDTVLEPAFWADSHLSSEALSPNDNLVKQALNSQVYLYDTEASSLAGYAVRPRQCVPLACIEFSPSSSRLDSVHPRHHLSLSSVPIVPISCESRHETLVGHQTPLVEGHFPVVNIIHPNHSEAHYRPQSSNPSTFSQSKDSLCNSHGVLPLSAVNAPNQTAVLIRPTHAATNIPTRPSEELSEQIRLLKVHHQLVVSLLQTFVSEMNAVVNALQRLRRFTSISVRVESALQTLVRLKTNFRDLSTKCQQYLLYLSQINSMQPGVQLASIDVLAYNVDSVSRCCRALFEIFRELRQWMTPSVEVGLFLSNVLLQRAPDVTRQLQIFSASLVEVVPVTNVCCAPSTVPHLSAASEGVHDPVRKMYQQSCSLTDRGELSSISHCTRQPIVIQPDGQFNHEGDTVTPLSAVNIKMEVSDDSFQEQLSDLIGSTSSVLSVQTTEEPSASCSPSTLQQANSSVTGSNELERDLDIRHTQLNCKLLSNSGQSSDLTEVSSLQHVKSEPSLKCIDGESLDVESIRVSHESSSEQIDSVSTSTGVDNNYYNELVSLSHRDDASRTCTSVHKQKISSSDATIEKVNQNPEKSCICSSMNSVSGDVEACQIESIGCTDTCSNAALDESSADKAANFPSDDEIASAGNRSVTVSLAIDLKTSSDNSSILSNSCAGDVDSISDSAELSGSSNSVTVAAVPINNAFYCSSVDETSCHMTDVSINDTCPSNDGINNVDNEIISCCESDINGARLELRISSTSLADTKHNVLSVEVSTDRRSSLFFELSSASKMEFNDIKNVVNETSERLQCERDVCTLHADGIEQLEICSTIEASESQLSCISSDTANSTNTSEVAAVECPLISSPSTNSHHNGETVIQAELLRSASPCHHLSDSAYDSNNALARLKAAEKSDTQCHELSKIVCGTPCNTKCNTGNLDGNLCDTLSQLQAAGEASNSTCKLLSVDFVNGSDATCLSEVADTSCAPHKLQSALPTTPEAGVIISDILRAVIGVQDNDCKSIPSDHCGKHNNCQLDTTVMRSKADSHCCNPTIGAITLNHETNSMHSMGYSCCYRDRVLEESGVFRISSVYSVKDVAPLHSQVTSDRNELSFAKEKYSISDDPVESDDFILAVRAFSRMAKVFFELRDSSYNKIGTTVKQEVMGCDLDCVDTSQEHNDDLDMAMSKFSEVVKVEEPEVDEFNLSKTIEAIQDIVAQSTIHNLPQVFETPFPNCSFSVTNKIRMRKKRKKRKRLTAQKNKKNKVPLEVDDCVTQCHELSVQLASCELPHYRDVSAIGCCEIRSGSTVDDSSHQSVSDMGRCNQPNYDHGSIITKENNVPLAEKKKRKRKLQSINIDVGNEFLPHTGSPMKRRSMTLTALQSDLPPCPIENDIGFVCDKISLANDEINSEKAVAEGTKPQCGKDLPEEVYVESSSNLGKTSTCSNLAASVKKSKKKKQKRCRKAKKKIKAVGKGTIAENFQDTGYTGESADNVALQENCTDADNSKELCIYEEEPERNCEVENVLFPSAVSKSKASAKDKVNAIFRNAAYTCLQKKVSSTALCKRDNKQNTATSTTHSRSVVSKPGTVESTLNLREQSVQQNSNATPNLVSITNSVTSSNVDVKTAPTRLLSYSEKLSAALDNCVQSGGGGSEHVDELVDNNNHVEVSELIPAKVADKSSNGDTLLDSVSFSAVDADREVNGPVYYTGIMQNYIPKLMSLYVEPTGTQKLCSRAPPDGTQLSSSNKPTPVNIRDPRVKVHADIQRSTQAISLDGWNFSLPTQREELVTYPARRVSYKKYVYQCLNKLKSPDNMCAVQSEPSTIPSCELSLLSLRKLASVPIDSFVESELPEERAVIASDILSELTVDDSLNVPSLNDSDWHCAKRVIRCASGLDRDPVQKPLVVCHTNTVSISQVPLDCPSLPEYAVMTESEVLAFNDLQMVDSNQPVMEDVDLVLKFPAMRMNGMFWKLIPLDTVLRASTVYETLNQMSHTNSYNKHDVDPRLCWRPALGSFHIFSDQAKEIAWELITAVKTGANILDSNCAVGEESSVFERIDAVTEFNDLLISMPNDVGKELRKATSCGKLHAAGLGTVSSSVVDSNCGLLAGNKSNNVGASSNQKSLEQFINGNYNVACGEYCGDFQMEKDVADESDGSLMIDLECEEDHQVDSDDGALSSTSEHQENHICDHGTVTSRFTNLLKTGTLQSDQSETVENSSEKEALNSYKACLENESTTSNVLHSMKPSAGTDMYSGTSGIESCVYLRLAEEKLNEQELCATSEEAAEKISQIHDGTQEGRDREVTADVTSENVPSFTSGSDTDVEKERTYDHISKQFRVVVSKLHNSRQRKVLLNTKRSYDASCWNLGLADQEGSRKCDLKLASDVSTESSNQSSSDVSFFTLSGTCGESSPAKNLPTKALSANMISCNFNVSGIKTLITSNSTLGTPLDASCTPVSTEAALHYQKLGSSSSHFLSSSTFGKLTSGSAMPTAKDNSVTSAKSSPCNHKSATKVESTMPIAADAKLVPCDEKLSSEMSTLSTCGRRAPSKRISCSTRDDKPIFVISSASQTTVQQRMYRKDKLSESVPADQNSIIEAELTSDASSALDAHKRLLVDCALCGQKSASRTASAINDTAAELIPGDQNSANEANSVRSAATIGETILGKLNKHMADTWIQSEDETTCSGQATVPTEIEQGKSRKDASIKRTSGDRISPSEGETIKSSACSDRLPSRRTSDDSTGGSRKSINEAASKTGVPSTESTPSDRNSTVKTESRKSSAGIDRHTSEDSTGGSRKSIKEAASKTRVPSTESTPSDRNSTVKTESRKSSAGIDRRTSEDSAGGSRKSIKEAASKTRVPSTESTPSDRNSTVKTESRKSSAGIDRRTSEDSTGGSRKSIKEAASKTRVPSTESTPSDRNSTVKTESRKSSAGIDRRTSEDSTGGSRKSIKEAASKTRVPSTESTPSDRNSTVKTESRKSSAGIDRRTSEDSAGGSRKSIKETASKTRVPSTESTPSDRNSTVKTESRKSSAGIDRHTSEDSTGGSRKSIKEAASKTRVPSTESTPSDRNSTVKTESRKSSAGIDRRTSEDSTGGSRKSIKEAACKTVVPLAESTPSDRNFSGKTESRKSFDGIDRLPSRRTSDDSTGGNHKSSSGASNTMKVISANPILDDQNSAGKAEWRNPAAGSERLPYKPEKLSSDDEKLATKLAALTGSHQRKSVLCSPTEFAPATTFTNTRKWKTSVVGCERKPISIDLTQKDQKLASEVALAMKNRAVEFISGNQNLISEAKLETSDAIRDIQSSKHASNDRSGVQKIASYLPAASHLKISDKVMSADLALSYHNSMDTMSKTLATGYKTIPSKRASCDSTCCVRTSSSKAALTTKNATAEFGSCDCYFGSKAKSRTSTANGEGMSSKHSLDICALDVQKSSNSVCAPAPGYQRKYSKEASAKIPHGDQVLPCKSESKSLFGEVDEIPVDRTLNNSSPIDDEPADEGAAVRFSAEIVESDLTKFSSKPAADKLAACDQTCSDVAVPCKSIENYVKLSDKPSSTKLIVQNMECSVEEGCNHSTSTDHTFSYKPVEFGSNSSLTASKLQYGQGERGYQDYTSLLNCDVCIDNQLNDNNTLNVLSARPLNRAVENNRISDVVEQRISGVVCLHTLPLHSFSKLPVPTDPCKEFNPSGTIISEGMPETNEVSQISFIGECNVDECQSLIDPSCDTSKLINNLCEHIENTNNLTHPKCLPTKRASFDSNGRIRSHDPKSGKCDEKRSVKHLQHENLVSQTMNTRSVKEISGEIGLKNLRCAGVLCEQVSCSWPEEGKAAMELNMKNVSLLQPVRQAEQIKCDSLRVQWADDHSAVSKTTKKPVLQMNSCSKKQRVAEVQAVTLVVNMSSNKHNFSDNVDEKLASDAASIAICDSDQDRVRIKTKTCDLVYQVLEEIERREKVIIKHNIYSCATGDLSSEEKKKLVAEHSLNPREEHELVVDLRLGTLQREVARIQELMEGIKDKFDPSKPSASLDRRYDQFEQKLNYLIVRCDWNYSRLNKLHRYYKSHLVLTVPDDLRINSEHGQYFSAEGVPMFVKNMTISLKQCTRLAALTKSIVAHKSMLNDRKSKVHADKLLWLHKERKTLLDEICCASILQRDNLIATFSDKLTLYRCTRLDLERREDEKSCELREFVDDTVDRLQQYISLLKSAKIKGDGTWLLTEDQPNGEDLELVDCTKADGSFTRCRQDLRLSKRQKILAVLNSVLEKKRKESSEVDNVDDCYSYSSSSAFEPALEESDSISLLTKACRKRTMRENNVSMTEIKKPLLGRSPFVFNKRLNVKTGCSTFGRMMERSSSSSAMLEEYPARKVFAGSYSKFAGSSQERERCATKEHTSRAQRSHQDSRLHYSNTSYRSRDDIRFSVQQPSFPDFRNMRVPVGQQQVGSRFRMDADEYCSSRPPSFDELHSRTVRSLPNDDKDTRQLGVKRGLLGDRPPSCESLCLLGESPSRMSSDLSLLDDRYLASQAFKQLSEADGSYSNRKTKRGFSPRSRYSHWP